MERRLAAILAADIVDYTRLMGEDHTRTLAALRQLRRELFEPLMSEHHGRVVKRMGDGWLVEFSTVSDAVRSSQLIQDNLKHHELIKMRIGIHSGEVMFEDEDVFGEGVNVAARLEEMGQAGDIMLSDTAHNSLDRVLGDGFSDTGEHALKNVARQVRIWCWRADRSNPTTNAAYAKDAATSALEEKPSLAVLPFTAMGSGEEYSAFADGMTEDLITDLSKISGLIVMARNSSFQFKDQNVDIREIGDRLGVKFILEGSLRRAGAVIRINAQLIEAANGAHLWADRYDGAIEDIFALQDKVCEEVVKSLEVKLTGVERERLARVPTNNLEAFETYLRARATPFPPLPDRVAAALDLFSKVIEADPEFAGGYGGGAWTKAFDALFGNGDKSLSIDEAEAEAKKAISLDDSLAVSHVALGMIHIYHRRHDEAIACAQTGIEAQPSDADAHAFYGLILGLSGNYAEAKERIDHALLLNPDFVYGPYLNMRTIIHLLSGDYEEALNSFNRNVQRQGPIAAFVYCWVAACNWALGNEEEAAHYASAIYDLHPEFTLEGWNLTRVVRDKGRREEIVGLMRGAGVK